LFEVACIDFTELLFAGEAREAHLIPIVGHVCKMAYGWAVGESANMALALDAWERDRETFREYDIPRAGMIVHHDQADRRHPMLSSPATIGRDNCS
jgi:hypothetical protein